VNQPTLHTGFEQRLLTQLRTVVAERSAAEAKTAEAPARPAWRRAPRLALGAAAAAAAVATALVVSAGGGNTQAAFAVEPQAGGSVNIEIYSLSDPSGLEAALAQAGIPADVTELPPLTACREPRFQGTDLAVPGLGSLLRAFTLGGLNGPLTVAIGNEQERQELFESVKNGQSTLFLNPDWFRSDQTLVISGSPDPYQGSSTGDNVNGYMTSVAVAEGPVAPCDPVPLSP